MQKLCKVLDDKILGVQKNKSSFIIRLHVNIMACEGILNDAIRFF